MQGKYERIFSKGAVKKVEEAGLPAALLALHCRLMRGLWVSVLFLLRRYDFVWNKTVKMDIDHFGEFPVSRRARQRR